MNKNNWITGRAKWPSGGYPVWQADNLAGTLFRTEFFGAPTAGGDAGYVEVWNGSAWVRKPMKVWNGSAWVIKPVKYWNGSAWSNS